MTVNTPATKGRQILFFGAWAPVTLCQSLFFAAPPSPLPYYVSIHPYQGLDMYECMYLTL